MSEDDFDDFDDETPELVEEFVEAPLHGKRSTKLEIRRRIEQLEELRRLRELLADDDFEFDNKY